MLALSSSLPKATPSTPPARSSPDPEAVRLTAGRRGALLRLSSGLLAAAFQPAAIADETPFEEGKRQPLGIERGRLQPCRGASNPNCVSTSSTTDQYAPAWTAPPALDEKQVAGVIEQTVLGTLPESDLLMQKSTEDGEYLAFSVGGGAFGGRDYIEFLVRPYNVEGRLWDGDEGSGRLVTYRSIAGEVKYIWPIQQPITDLDTQKKRMKALREKLNFRLVGCELLECYG